MADRLTFFQRYQETASPELTVYIFPNGVVTTEPVEPTREEIVQSTMETRHTIVTRLGPGEFERSHRFPTREEAETNLDRALNRYREGRIPPQGPAPVRYADLQGRKFEAVPIDVVCADGTRTEWPPLEWRE